MLKRKIDRFLIDFFKTSRNALLQPLIIHRKSLLDILMKPLSSPTAKASRHLGLYTITKGNYHIKIIVVNATFYLTITLLSNCQEILYSSICV